MNVHPGQERDEFALPKILSDQRESVDQWPKYAKRLYTEKSTYILWIASSWTIAFLNLIFVGLSIRDMWNNGYSAGTHWLSSAVIVATMFGLMIIHEYVIRKKKDGS